MKKLSIALIAVLVVASLTSCTTVGDGSDSKTSSSTEAESTIAELSQESAPPDTDPEPIPFTPYALGDTFTTDLFEVTLGKELGDFKKVDNKYSEHHEKEVVVLPMKIKNIAGGKNLFNPLFVKIFAPDGVQSRYLGVLFADDDVFRVGEMMDGAEVDTNFHFEYRGDGDYRIEFFSADETSVAKIPVMK